MALGVIEAAEKFRELKAGQPISDIQFVVGRAVVVASIFTTHSNHLGIAEIAGGRVTRHRLTMAVRSYCKLAHC